MRRTVRAIVAGWVGSDTRGGDVDGGVSEPCEAERLKLVVGATAGIPSGDDGLERTHAGARGEGDAHVGAGERCGGAAFEAGGTTSIGPVGNATGRLMSQRAVVDFATDWIAADRAVAG